MTAIRYQKITLVDGTRFILRVTGETPLLVRGYEVNADGDEIAPPGYDRRLRVVDRASIKKSVALRMSPHYATLEPLRDGHATAKVSGGSTMSKKLNYGDFSRTGYQDCGNTFDTSEHYEAWRRIGKPRGVSAAQIVVRAVWGDDADAYDAWLEQADVDDIIGDGLELRAAYKAWRTAWQDCAESNVKAAMKQWIAREAE